jgi:hypothetical protein
MGVLDILHPVGVTAEGSHPALEIPVVYQLDIIKRVATNGSNKNQSGTYPFRF